MGIANRTCVDLFMNRSKLLYNITKNVFICMLVLVKRLHFEIVWWYNMVHRILSD